MPLSDGQYQVGHSERRFRVLIAGRRFGKTYLAIRELAKFARQPNRSIVYIAPSYRQAKTIVWKELKEKLGKLRWIKKVNESELTIHLVNNSTIALRSAENYDSIRGMGIDFAVFDEFADIAEETWTEAVRPALSDRLGHALFIGTPKGVSNWAKDLYERGQLPGETTWGSWQFTTIDGGNVPESEIAAAQEDLDERTFRQEYLASFETYSGIIYYNYTPAVVYEEKPEITDKSILHIGMDYNVNPLTAVISISDGKTIQVIDEIAIYGSDTYEMVAELEDRYPNNRKVIYPDASGANRRTSGTSDVRILKEAGYAVKMSNRNPPVRDRINSVNAAFKNSKGDARLTIHKSCKQLTNCLNKQIYKPDTQQPDKNSGFDHMNDALGYLVWQILPIKSPPVKQDNSYFGMV